MHVSSVKDEVQKIRPIKDDDAALEHQKHLVLSFTNMYYMQSSSTCTNRLTYNPSMSIPYPKIIRGWECALVELKEALLCKKTLNLHSCNCDEYSEGDVLILKMMLQLFSITGI